MKSTIALLALAQGIAGHVVRQAEDCKTTGKAVYLITNDEANAIVAMPIKSDGTLGAGTVTPAGGKGSSSIDGMTNQPAGPDALLSQSALTVAGGYVFAVNPGSNSLSMLSISNRDPTKLTLVGKPAPIPGEFPNTVAASAKNKLVCVGASGSTAGITCAPFTRKGVGAMDTLRSIDLGQSTPPVGPTNTVSQAFFSEDESTLFTTVKGDPAVNKTGFLSSLAIQQGPSCGGSSVASVSPKDARFSPNGTAVLFGSQIIPGTNNIFATDASFGAAILSVDAKTGQASVAAKQVVADQKATCWSAFSKSTGSVYVTDVAIPRVLEMSAKDASIISTIDLSAAGDPGFIDLKASGDFLYVLSPGNGTSTATINVLDLSGGQGKAKSIQRFELGMQAGKSAQGIAILD
ncbi:uncharacterized protein GGS22DRAFT_187050 [Annulohypoxylon maeteangense]|uniref:uncharacterized protein n=1 Tax=Annulohypoxylon maeteangense TaxID=1927788 RepID=UPI0020078ED3|nr:uncharacterized protein GGS22DRAFT_187050 [Annulohypoxylon maeteangense]KAI0886970.1 hypothetical protein GGS22DRAFT_187050 [Annulohypoxylon maeteangense]